MEIKILADLCRICLSDNVQMSIFDTMNKEPICDKIMACATVHVVSGDPLPSRICEQCYRALEISYLFKTKCEEMDRQLRMIIKNQTQQQLSATSPIFKQTENETISQNTCNSPQSENEKIVESEVLGDDEPNINDIIDHENFHYFDENLGEECEVITEEITDSQSDTLPKNHSFVPKGKFVIIKSVIKQNTTPGVIPEIPPEMISIPLVTPTSIRKVIKSEIPEPASFVETETQDDIGESEKVVLNSSNSTVKKEITIVPNRKNYKGRGRPRKVDKYKPPHGVSYLKSGKKNNSIFRIKRSGNSAFNYTFPVVKRARVEKIIPPKKYLDKKPEMNRKLSTNLLLTNKHKLNDSQKQVLYQRLKLQSFRPTSKKDISERGIPNPVNLSDDENDDENKKRKVCLNKKPQLQSLQTIDQDLKMIQDGSYNQKVSDTTPTSEKIGRHTAIKSKKPQKRNNRESEKFEIEMKVPRKSERQRSPKKIFPEIDIFTSPKIKHEENELSEYEIEKNENILKIKIRGKRTCFNEEESVEDTEGEDSISSDTQEDSLEKDERVALDYGAGLSCNVCHKSFPYRSHLIRHVHTHTGLKPFTCEYCKKNFTTLSSLNIHVKNHIGDHPYTCEVCGRGFVQPSVLKRHMLSHTGEHPYECKICSKSFVHDSSLKTHLKMHTIQEPQHACEICAKRFKYLSTLTSHLKTHSGIKPFTCPECRKAFYRRSLLTRHMRSHTKERPYKCKLCKARFAYSGGLASHMKLHTGVRPYQCQLCDFTFFRSSHLKNHMQKIHNNGLLLSCQSCNLSFDSKPLFKRHLSGHIKSNNGNGAIEYSGESEEDEKSVAESENYSKN